MYGDRRKPLMIMLLLALLVLGGVAYWKLMMKPQLGPYGAIAMSDTSLTYGGAWGYPDPIAAYKRSISECNKAAGNNDCVVKVTLKDNCGALAISTEHNASFLVQGRDQVTATATAMEQCQATGASDCSIHENICSSNS
jgi:Flp pilus assembly protein TadG